MRSGHIYMYGGYTRAAGFYGFYWSCGNSTATLAYGLGFIASEIYPSYGPDNRYYGFSLRCLQE